MYTLALILLLATALYITIRGTTIKKTAVIVTGLTIGILTLLFFGFMNFWGEKLWFDQMGYNDRFWTEWSFKIGLLIVAFLAGGLIIYLLTYSISKEKRYIRQIAVAGGAILSGFWWYARWEMVLKFINRIPTDISEPILNQQTGFYLFSYPILQSLYAHLLVLSIIAVGASLLGFAYMRQVNNDSINIPSPLPPFASVFIGTGVLLLILALGKYIARYGLLYSEFGIVSGPGWTDVNIRLPMLTVVAIITAISGVVLIVPGLRNGVRNIFGRRTSQLRLSAIYAVIGVVFGTWLILLGLVPVLFQWLKVEPNEITVEKPYIENNIRFTRLGFHLDKVEEKEYAVSEEFQREAIEENKNLFSNIRLWDYRALDAVFKQFQEIRLYYEFDDVDIDRYTIDGFYREVMVSAREMQPGNLPLESQTFVNERFKYTHGYGAVLNLVNEFTPDGLPNLLIKDIPPVSSYENLTINRPELYYGELSGQYVVANSKETEFDYPSGEKNVYAHYDGSGGVQISNFWRKLLYGWKFGGTKFLLSGYPSRESRIMMHRQIAERVNEIAPFLLFDDDPYIVISEGKLFWIIDAYTSSSYYPYSEPFSSFERISYDRYNSAGSIQGLVGAHLQGENYIRNSVKIVIDAFNGNTDLYIFEEGDPLVQVYNKIFPGLLKNKSEMPESLKKHIRYPADMLLVQGMVYAKYHMQDPTVFYNQEDLWVRATEKYYSNVQPVEPYYIMWEPPGSGEMEFVLILPFTPKNKQVMIGWIAGMCDDENYGRFLAYQFPKEKRVLGTQQVETKIDQDSYLSGQLTLWDQRGSNVIRGNVLAIPINNTIIYVEPIYLKSETSAYPELRLVAVMHNDNLSYAETFDEALMNLFTRTSGQREAEDTELTGTESMHELIDRANEAFENYLQYMQQREFEKAGSALQNLEEALQKLSEEDTTEGVK
jgi:uncharacterized membrane protein (UPF0182 family)